MEDERTNDDVFVIPKEEIWFTASRSSGPGGQHVNKTNSRVTLHWNVRESKAVDAHLRAKLLWRLRHRLNGRGILQISVEDHRSQRRNREIAMERLVKMVAGALVESRPRQPTQISRAAVKRRLENKRRMSMKKSMRKAPGREV